MKLKCIALLLLPLSLAACQSNEIQKVGDLAVTALQQQNAHQTLTAYEWQLDTGANKPMVVHFDAEGRFSVTTTCNTLVGGWKIASHILETGQSMLSMMACSDDAMKQERLAVQIFDNAKIAFALNTTNVNAPTLTLTTDSEQRYVLTGKMTPETKYQGQAETIFLEISPETKTCTGVTPLTCLQVKEVQYNEQGLKTHHDEKWSLFYDSIEGFAHSSTERKIIRVKRFTIPNPAADQSKYAYIYDMTVQSEVVK